LPTTYVHALEFALLYFSVGLEAGNYGRLLRTPGSFAKLQANLPFVWFEFHQTTMVSKPQTPTTGKASVLSLRVRRLPLATHFATSGLGRSRCSLAGCR